MLIGDLALIGDRTFIGSFPVVLLHDLGEAYAFKQLQLQLQLHYNYNYYYYY